MIANSMNEQLNLHVNIPISKSTGDILRIELNKDAKITNSLLSSIVFSMYDVRRDDSLFRTQCFDGPSFDYLRKNYEERHEFDTVILKCANPEQVRKLYHLGFQIRT